MAFGRNPDRRYRHGHFSLGSARCPTALVHEGGNNHSANEILTAGFSLESLTEASAEEESLGAALTSPAWVPSSRWERAQTRALSTLEKDIDAAIEAYKNNPALVRAGAVVNANRERKKEISKTLYANRDL